MDAEDLIWVNCWYFTFKRMLLKPWATVFLEIMQVWEKNVTNLLKWYHYSTFKLKLPLTKYQTSYRIFIFHLFILHDFYINQNILLNFYINYKKFISH